MTKYTGPLGEVTMRRLTEYTEFDFGTYVKGYGPGTTVLTDSEGADHIIDLVDFEADYSEVKPKKRAAPKAKPEPEAKAEAAPKKTTKKRTTKKG